MKGRIMGLACAVTGAALYGLNPLFAVPLYGEGMKPASVLFFRYVIAALILFAFLLAKRVPLRLGRRQCGWMLLFGVLFALSSQLLFEGYRWMDVGLASALLFIYPVIVAVFMALFFHERITLSTVISLMMAVCGVFLLSGAGSGSGASLTAFMLVMLSAFTYAGYLIGIRETCVRDLDSTTVTFYTLVFGFAVFGASILFRDGMQVPATAGGWWLVLGSAFVCTTLSAAAIAMAIRLIGPTVTSILGALEPLAGVATGVLVFGETLTAGNIAGIALIIAAVTLIVTAPLLMHRLRYGGRRY